MEDIEAELRDMEAELGEVHGDGEGIVAGGDTLWTPVAFSAHRPCQHAWLYQEEAGGEAVLLDT